MATRLRVHTIALRAGALSVGDCSRDVDVAQGSLASSAAPVPDAMSGARTVGAWQAMKTASQLNVPAGHVWDGAASGDMVTWTRWFGNVDPSTSDFGAHRFEAETVTRSGDGTRNTGEHSHYFDPDSESLNNISQVVLGRDQNVIPAQYRQNDLVVAAYDSYAVIFGAESDPEVNRPVTTFR